MRIPLWSLRCRSIPAYVTLLTIGAGCAALDFSGLSGLIPSPSDIPPELAAVFDADTLICADPNGLNELPEGSTPVSDLGTLDGCWGGCLETRTAIPGRTFGVTQVLRFDTAGGRLKRFIYQSIAVVPDFIDVQEGVLTLDDAGTAAFEVTRILSTANPALRGELIDISDKWTTLPVYDVRLEMDGERLIADFDQRDTPATSGGFADRVLLAHTRFDCP